MLKFLGVGSAFNTELGNNSAWLCNGTQLVLLDCGGTVFERTLKRKLLKDTTSLDICLTHTHGDHVGSLGDLILYCHYLLNMKPTIRHPEGERIRKLLTLLGVPEETYVLADGSAFSLEDWLEGRFVRQIHADTMPAYGLMLKHSGQTIWYSGDSKGIPMDILEAFLNGEIDVFYQDASGRDDPDSMHMSLDHLKDLIPEALRHKVVCMHQDEAFNRETAQSLGFQIAEVAGDSPGEK